MQKAYVLCFIKSVLSWRNLLLAFQSLLKRSLLISVIALVLRKEQVLSQGFVEGKMHWIWGLKSSDNHLSPILVHRPYFPASRCLFPKDCWQTTYPTSFDPEK